MLAYPNPEATWYEICERMVADVALSGNAYAKITRDGRGSPSQIIYLPPANVSAERLAMGRIVYRVNSPIDNTMRVLSDEDVIHPKFRLNPGDPLRGLALTGIGAGTLELSAAVERHARNLFARGARPGGLLKLEKKLHPDAKMRLRAQIEEFLGGQNSGRVAVLEEGMDFDPLTVNNRDSQLVETSEALVGAVARLFGIPAPLVGQLSNVNYSSLTALVSTWSRTGLRSWLARFEGVLTDKLLSEDSKRDGLVVKFDTSELVRLDERERAEVAAKLTGAGIVTANEARKAQGLPPIAGGDELVRMPGATAAGEPGRPQGARDLASGDPTHGPNPET